MSTENLKLILIDGGNHFQEKCVFQKDNFNVPHHFDNASGIIKLIDWDNSVHDDLINLFWMPNYCISKKVFLKRRGYQIPVEARKNENIKELHFFFLDFDLKDATGNHYIGEELKQRKEELFSRFRSKLPLAPDYVVESRNGFHVYYVIPKNRIDMGIENWKHIEKGIHLYCMKDFSDTLDNAVTAPSNLLRLPGSFHMKANDTEPFQIDFKYIRNEEKKLNLLRKNEYKSKMFSYELREIIKAFQIPRPEENIVIPAPPKTKSNVISTTGKTTTIPYRKYDFVDAVLDKDYDNPIFQHLKDKYSGTYKTHKEATDLINSIDMREILGIDANINEHISSLFYQDKTPSDNFALDKMTNQVYYFCHSNREHFPYNSISLIVVRIMFDKFQNREVTKAERTEAFDFIYKMFGMTFERYGAPIKEGAMKKRARKNIERIKKAAEKDNNASFLKSAIPVYEVAMKLLIEQRTKYGLQTDKPQRTMTEDLICDNMKEHKHHINQILNILVYIGALKRVAHNRLTINQYRQIDMLTRTKKIKLHDTTEKLGNTYEFVTLSRSDIPEIIEKAVAIKQKFKNPICEFSWEKMID